MKKGFFITFEGGDGCGKSTQLALFQKYLEQKKIPCVITEEPGGTLLGKEIKSLLLDARFGKLTPTAELLLFAAARAQHVEELIAPALAKGKCVVSSRFADATTVYQGIARGLNMKLIAELAQVATQGLKPDLTFLLDIDPKVGLKRTQEVDKESAPKGKVDKIEAEGIPFQKKVREGYLQLAQQEPNRFYVISSELSIEKIHQKIVAHVHSKLKL